MYHIYADDDQLYKFVNPRSTTDLYSAIDNLNELVKVLFNWMTVNKLKANSSKTEFIILGSPHSMKLLPTELHLTIDGTDIHPTDHVRNHGNIFDKNLSLSDHVNSICRTANYHMYCIGKICYLLDDVSCKAAVSSLVLSRLDYANSLLIGSNGKLIKRLQLIQNNAARLITTKMSDHITPILSSLHWLPILVRIEFKLLLIIYKCLNNQCPNYLQSLVSVYVPARSLRSSQDSCCLTKGIPQRSYGKRAFAFAAPPLWNALPLSIRISPSVQSFKSSLKTHLFRRTYILN